MQKKPKSTNTAKPHKTGKFPGAVAGNEPAKPLPPGMVTRIARNNRYYKDLEHIIRRSIYG